MKQKNGQVIHFAEYFRLNFEFRTCWINTEKLSEKKANDNGTPEAMLCS